MQPLAPLFSEAFCHRFSQILYRCFEEVRSMKGALYLRHGEDEAFRLASHYGWPRLGPPPESLEVGHPFVSWIRRERRSFVVDSPGPELEGFCQGVLSPRFLMTPIYDSAEWVGILLQRDKARGEAFRLDRDEPLTRSVCDEVVETLREYRVMLHPRDPASEPVVYVAEEDVTPMPVAVPSSDAMVRPSGKDRTPTGELAEGKPQAPEVRAKQGTFLPEHRTFFWEVAGLLCGMVPMAAAALWMEEAREVRPILTYSHLPLAPELKQQILAHMTYHIPHAPVSALSLLAKAAFPEREALQGVFQTYLPVLLMGERGGQDMLMLFRLDEQPFSSREQTVIRQVARLLGYHLQEARLHEHYHMAFLSVAHHILANVEGGSPMLKSHSVNTAKLARNFAVRLGLASSEIEAVSIAAILHDVGTLLLDPELVSKPQLDPSDLSRIRTHPVLASAFLKDVHFPFDVLSIIRHHHERWDGRGYPDGLVGEDIPMGSRIINLVESFDVMMSGNEFKEPRAYPEILQEIRREAGRQFDPGLAESFIAHLLATSQ